jgi:outer membrane protein
MVIPVMALTLVSAAHAQDLPASQDVTPPVAPKIVETPLPPPVTVAPPEQVPADVPNTPLSAEEAVRIALRHQPNLTVAASNVEAARGRVQQSRSALRPSLGVSTGYTRTETLASAGGGGGGTSGSGGTGGTVGTGGAFSSSGFTASATVRQLLFDFYHTRESVRQASQQEVAAGHNLSRVQLDTALQVKQAFYAYVQANRLIGANESDLRSRESQRALAQARLTAGLGLPSDVVRAQTAVADATLSLNLAQNSASLARMNLALLMGLDPRTPLVAGEAGEPEPASLELPDLVRTALRQRPDVLQALALVSAAEHGVKAASSTDAPAISFSASLGSRGTSFLPGNDTASLGVSVAWTPFDSGLTAGRTREARAGATAAQAQLESTRLGVTSDVSQAYVNLRTAEQRVVTADSEVANAQEGARLAEGRYRSGVGTFLDVIDAQAALLTAQTNRINAQTSVDQARAALSHALGAPVP